MIDALGIYLLCSLGFVVSALVEFAVVVWIKRKSVTSNSKVRPTMLTRKKKQANAMLQHKNQTIWATLKDDTEKDQPLNNGNISVQMLTEHEMAAFLLAIDYKAFWALLFLYFMFNCLYWNLFICH